jgi:Cdc6-like AAA superfamily ATPase
MKRIHKIYDATTGEETIIEREETAEETQARLDAAAENAAAETAAQVKADARAAIATKLGLTAEELATLFG